METERSIVLQKKMILFLSLMIVSVFSLIYINENDEEPVNSYASEVTYVSEAMKTDLLEVSNVVVKDENEIIKKNIEFLASGIVADRGLIDVETGDISGETVEMEESFTHADSEENVEVPNVVENSVVSDEITKKNDNVPNNLRYKDLAEDTPPTEYESVIEVSATAYCLCKKCCGKSPSNPYYGYTHSGIKIEPGTGMKIIAVDPSIIPLKSNVYVEGLNGAWDYGNAIAADTGSAIKEKKIDLYMDTHEEALEWGRKKVKVYILAD